MSRGRGARASISRSVMHGLVGWGCLLSVAAGVVVTRLHTAEANRAPLPVVTASLSADQYREWASFPDYHKIVPVLMYHSIGGKASYLTVSRKLFAEQMRALKVAGFHTLTIQQYAHFVKHGYRGLPSRPILLTFDDGREDAYRAANGLLQAYGFHVTDLVVPAWVTGHPHFSLSWSQLQQMAQTSTWSVQLHFGYGREQITYNNTTAALFVAPTKRTPTPFAKAEAAVLSDLENTNASAANIEKEGILYRSVVAVDPAFGRWGLGTSGPSVFAPAAPSSSIVGSQTVAALGVGVTRYK